MAIQYWLMKSEPDVYSIDDLARDGTAPWDGVRNNVAKNHLKRMQVGDKAFFYHSRLDPPGVAGICKVVKTAYPDATARDPQSAYYDDRATDKNPRWFAVDVAFVEKFDGLVDLHTIKATRGLQNMVLVRNTRLSVQPVTKSEWNIILRMARGRS